MDDSTQTLSKLSLLALLELGVLPFVALFARWELALLGLVAYMAAFLHVRVRTAIRYRTYLAYLVLLVGLAATARVLIQQHPPQAGVVAILVGSVVLVLMLKMSTLMKAQFGYTA